jgi:nitronate monooxygenase
VILDQFEHPIVLAPLAGGPSTPELTAAVSDAGGLGFLATGYLTAEATLDRVRRLRSLTERPFGVNLFVPGEPTPAREYEAFSRRLRSAARATGAPVGEPRFDDDAWDAKLELLRSDPPAVVSFTFGCPVENVIAELRDAGSEVWVTVTSADEAEQAARAGADALVAQGAEAGGHRGSFVDRPGLPSYGVLALLQLVGDRVDLPLIASGGIATGEAIAAVLCAGASAAQLGTAFMLCPEAGTPEVLREALKTPAPTALTRAFTGRLARGIRNGFMAEHGEDAPVAYPEIHHLTAPLRAAAREAGEPEQVNLWAGEAHELARAVPAAKLVRELAAEARRALATGRLC